MKAKLEELLSSFIEIGKKKWGFFNLLNVIGAKWQNSNEQQQKTKSKLSILDLLVGGYHRSYYEKAKLINRRALFINAKNLMNSSSNKLNHN